MIQFIFETIYTIQSAYLDYFFCMNKIAPKNTFDIHVVIITLKSICPFIKRIYKYTLFVIELSALIN